MGPVGADVGSAFGQVHRLCSTETPPLVWAAFEPPTTGRGIAPHHRGMAELPHSYALRRHTLVGMVRDRMLDWTDF